jgi:hypothetical protein
VQTESAKNYWLLYPLENIDGLWESDIQFLRSQWAADENVAASDAKWQQLYSFQVREKKSVYELQPDLSVVEDVVGRRSENSGRYDFGNFLRFVEFEIEKKQVQTFEKFVVENVVPASSRFLPKLKNRNLDKLPRFIRSVKLEVHQSRVPEFLDLTQRHLLTAAGQNKVSYFFYHSVFAGGDNFFFFCPFEGTRDAANTKTPFLPDLIQRTYKGPEARRIASAFSGLIIRGEEWVGQIRPDLSTNLDNKYKKWW